MLFAASKYPTVLAKTSHGIYGYVSARGASSVPKLPCRHSLAMREMGCAPGTLLHPEFYRKE